MTPKILEEKSGKEEEINQEKKVYDTLKKLIIKGDKK